MADMPCAQSGIEKTGVRRPLIIIKTITKKNITSIPWSMVDEKLEHIIPKPEIKRRKSREAKYMLSTEPAGESPYMSQDIIIERLRTKKPIIQ